MQFFSILLVLSSSVGTVVGTNIRGSGPYQEETQQQSDRDLSEASTLFDHSHGPSGKKVDVPKNDDIEDEDTAVIDVDYDPIADDSEAAAEALGLNLNDAQELLKQQKFFSELVDLLQEDDKFLQAEMPPVPDGEYVIKYKNGRIPKESQNAIENFKKKNKQAKVNNVATKLSLKDAQVRGDYLARKLEKKGYSNVSFSIDGDAIEVTAKNSLEQSDKQDKEDIGKIPNARAAEILGLPVDDDDILDEEFSLYIVEFEDEDPEEPYHTYGGRKIYGGGYQCTTAFSVRSFTGTTGVLTAGHCNGMNMYDAVPPQADYPASGQQQHMGLFGDGEWHTTTHWELPQYYATPSLRWPVRSIGSSVSKGQVVCGYSRMQGVRKCDRVYRTSVSVNYSCCPRMYNLVAMRNNMMIGGDSGGPWSYSDRAYGIVSGYKTIWFKRRDLWSRVYYMQFGLGVQVITQ